MKKFSYFIAILIISVLLTSVSVFSADKDKDEKDAESKFTDVDSSAGYSKEVTVLSENGIIEGDTDGNFRPDDSITRAEFAAIICRVMGEEVVEGALRPENLNRDWYIDVMPDYWAAGYIFTATSYGAMRGYGDRRFGPEAPVTNEQVIKTLVSAWGYGAEAEELGGYPNGYMAIADKYGVLNTVAFNYGNASKRWVVSMFVYGVLEKLPVSELAPKRPIPSIPPTAENPEKKEPLSENSDRFPDDPVGILKRVTNQSAKYEETEFNNFSALIASLPFVFDGNNIVYCDTIDNKNVLIGIGKEGSKEDFGTLYATEELRILNLAHLPLDEWYFFCTITEGSIKDSYQGKFIKNSDGLSFSSAIWRNVSLNVSIKQTEIRHEIILSNTETGDIIPFVVRATTNQNGEMVLYIDCPAILDSEHFFQYSMNTVGDKIEHIATERIFGENARLQPIIIQGIKQDIEYHLQAGIFSEYFEHNIIKGNIIFTIEDGKADFIFEGYFIQLAVDGYEIIDY